MVHLYLLAGAFSDRSDGGRVLRVEVIMNPRHRSLNVFLTRFLSLFVVGILPAHAADPSIVLHTWLSGSNLELPQASQAPDSLFSHARMAKEAISHACGTATQGADGVAAFMLGCPAILLPVGENLDQVCAPEELAISLRTLISIGEMGAADAQCTAGKAANDLLVNLSAQWASNRWPTPTEAPHYDTGPQLPDPRMAGAIARSAGVTDPDVLRTVIDSSLALEIAFAHSNDFTLTAQVAEEEAHTGMEFVPATGSQGAEGGRVRRLACDRFRTTLVSLSRMKVPDPVLALLAFPAVVESQSADGAIPQCHLPSSEFSETRLIQLYSSLGDPLVRGAPAMLKWLAVAGADDHYVRWRTTFAAGSTRDDQIALDYIRATQRRAAIYLEEHHHTDYNPDFEIPLSGRSLVLALRLLQDGRGVIRYDTLRGEVADHVVATLFVMERDESHTNPVFLDPSGSYTTRTFWRRLPIAGQLSPAPGSPTAPVVTTAADIGAPIFQPGQALDGVCVFSAADAATVQLFNANAAELAPTLAQDVVASICAAMPASATATGVWASRATTELVGTYHESATLIVARIGDGPNIGAFGRSRERPAPRQTPACLWKETPPYDVVEALGYDRISASYRKLASEAAYGSSPVASWYRDYATAARACEANWLEKNDLADVARLVSQDRQAGSSLCNRRSLDDLPTRDTSGGRVTLLVLAEGYTPVTLAVDPAPKGQENATIFAEDILGRAITGLFPITECSGWEIRHSDQNYIVVRAPVGDWTSADGQSWPVKESPTWIPARPIPPDPHLPGRRAPLSTIGGSDSDRIDTYRSTTNNNTDSTEHTGGRDTHPGPWLAAAIGTGIVGGVALTDGGIRLGNGVRAINAANTARSTTTPATWMQSVETARTNQAIGGTELVGGAALVATSVWCFAHLLPPHPPAPPTAPTESQPISLLLTPLAGGAYVRLSLDF